MDSDFFWSVIWIIPWWLTDEKRIADALEWVFLFIVGGMLSFKYGHEKNWLHVTCIPRVTWSIVNCFFQTLNW